MMDPAMFELLLEETRMTPDLSTYTTSELARLVTLTCATAATEDYINFCNTIYLRTVLDANVVGALVTQSGRCTMAGNNFTPVRRVRSFTDLTEVDPPVDVMLAELERRKEAERQKIVDTLRLGDTVRWHGNTYTVNGFLFNGCIPSITVTLSHPGWGEVQADPREVTKVEPPKPQPIPGQVYRHRETTDERPADAYYSLYRVNNGRLEYQEYPYESWKPAMLKSLAEFHREVANGTRVPYTPPVISNATHAGRRVRVTGDTYTTGRTHPTQNGRVMDSRAERIAHAGFTAFNGSAYRKDVVVVALDSGALVGASRDTITLLD